jgi:HAD superfamily hydrolase (TIGR01549 family)
MEIEIKVKNVLVDVDNTLTYERNNYLRKGIPGGDNYMMLLLAEILAEKFRISFLLALEKAKNGAKPCGRMNPFFAVENNPQWRISETELWNRCIDWQEHHLFFYKDAVYMVKQLKKRGFNLMVASNNGTKGILLKLARGGFAGRDGTDYFSRLFGDDLTGCQKDNARYFKEVIKMSKIDPLKSVMIGDNLEQDCFIPQQAGFKNIIIVDRKSRKKIIKNEAVVVNSLKTVVDILQIL